MNHYLLTDNQIQTGYFYRRKKEHSKCCDVWLEAWEGIKGFMAEELLDDIRGVEKIYEWTQYISNFVQDLETGLLNAAVHDKTYYTIHVKYCYELYERLNPADQLMRENTRRAMASTYFILGQHERAEHEFEAMLREDPDAGWVYVGWADCYAWELDPPRYDIAYGILSRGLSQPCLRERDAVLERIVEVSETSGDKTKAELHYLQLRSIEKQGSFLQENPEIALRLNIDTILKEFPPH